MSDLTLHTLIIIIPSWFLSLLGRSIYQTIKTLFDLTFSNTIYNTTPRHNMPHLTPYSIVQCSAVQSTVQHNMAWHSTAQYFTTRGKQKQQKWYLLRGENTSLCILFSTLFSVFANVFMFDIVHTLYMNTICFFNQVFSCFRENLAK